MNDFDLSYIESTFADAVRGIGVSDKVFFNRPRSASLDLKDFVVCHVSGGLNDLAALGRCTVSVSLFAQDVANMKNAKKLSVMQKKLQSLPLWLDKLLIDGHPKIVGDTSDGNGYHVRIINFKVYIKTT